MRIEAGGKTWIVEQQELAEGVWGSERFSGVTFRTTDFAADELHVRWVVKPDRLTPRLAEELFALAGERAWRDPRDGCLYELRLDGNTCPTAAGGQPAPLEAVRFQSEEGETFEAGWTLAKPLGWATDRELTALLDLARRAPTQGLPRG